jgi:hypothetical protein
MLEQPVQSAFRDWFMRLEVLPPEPAYLDCKATSFDGRPVNILDIFASRISQLKEMECAFAAV